MQFAFWLKILIPFNGDVNQWSISLESDRKAPRKQRHTAHRIWTRLREEHPEHPVGEPTIRRYVRLRKQEPSVGARIAELRVVL